VSGGHIGACMGDSNVDRYLVFHGGSGSTKEEINTAVGNGVVKMNVDTDTQYAYLIGIRVRSDEILHSFDPC
jgi:fructose/tagatose bisphosphate aldolase